MMIVEAANPTTDTLQGLIEGQALRIEMLRAQIHAFRALANSIERESPKLTAMHRSRPRRVIQNIPA
jgi:hypothetical protein